MLAGMLIQVFLYLHQSTTVSMKCSLGSCLVGMTVTALIQFKTNGFISIRLAVQEVPLSAFSSFFVPTTNESDEIIKVARGAFVGKVSFCLEQELHCDDISLEDFMEVENCLDFGGWVSLLDPDVYDEILP